MTPNQEIKTYTVPGMSCSHCVTAIRDEVGRLAGVDEVDVGAKGHLVALRAEDLAYLHTHPAGSEGHGGGRSDAIGFETEFPTDGSYRLFLQFKHAGDVHTAEFTQVVAE